MDRSLAPIYLLIVLLAIAADIFILVRWRKRRRHRETLDTARPEAVILFGQVSPVMTAVRRFFYRFQQRYPRLELPQLGSKLLEIVPILLWAVWVSRKLLNFSPFEVPNGNEFGNLIQTHFIWSLVPRCGWCFLWNGSLNGGAPALAELSGAVLHPLVFIPALLWGPINGAKVTFAASLALAGLAQWKLSRVLGLGRLARIWSGLIIIVGGQLAGKMENGNLALVLGQACAILVLAFGVDLLYNRQRASLVWLGLSIALVILSGEGYIQIGMALTLLPLLGLFCLTARQGARSAWKDYAVAIGLALLLAGVFLVPMGHLLPQIHKDADFTLGNFPPLAYIPLNLVINDVNFYHSYVLGIDPYPYLHVIFIGWIPVLLALISLKLTPARLNRLLWIFWVGVFLTFAVTSLDLMSQLLEQFPIVTKLRHLTVASGLVVPLLIGLAGIGLDQLVGRINQWLRAQKPLCGPLPRCASLAAAMVLIFLSIKPCYEFSQEFLGTHNIEPEFIQANQLETPTSQWVMPPHVDSGRLAYNWTLAMLSRGLKIADTWRPWALQIDYKPMPHVKGMSIESVNYAQHSSIYDQVSARTLADYAYITDPRVQYAYVIEDPPQRTSIPCQANSRGGWIDVICENEHPGTLFVEENALPGWQVWMDGKAIRLAPAFWLTTQAQPGKHQYQFRYLPWDAPLGALLTLIGIALAVWLQRRIKHTAAE